MVGHIDNGRSRCRGLIQNINGIVVSKRIGDKCCDSSREIVVPVRRIHLEFDMVLTYFNHLVWLILPTGRSAVKAMSEIVLRKVILHTVDRELTLIDTVGIASDSCAEIALMILRIIILNIVKSKDNITPYTVLVGNQNRSDTTTEIGYIHLHTGLVFQTVDFVAILLRRRASHCSKGAYTHCNRN